MANKLQISQQSGEFLKRMIIMRCGQIDVAIPKLSISRGKLFGLFKKEIVSELEIRRIARELDIPLADFGIGQSKDDQIEQLSDRVEELEKQIAILAQKINQQDSIELEQMQRAETTRSKY